MAKLVLQPDECSPLGKWFLAWLETNEKSMNSIAEKMGMSQPGLRDACMKGSVPKPSTVEKLAEVTETPLDFLKSLAYEVNLGNSPYKQNSRGRIQISVFDVAAHYKVLKAQFGELEPEDRPSNRDLMDAALELVKMGATA